MAKGSFYTQFRGEEYSVAYDLDFSGPGSGVGGEWWFEGLTSEQHDALNITADEETAIFGQCVAYADGLMREPMEGDVGILSAAELGLSRPLGTPISKISGRPGHEGYAEFVRIAKSWGYE